MVGRLVEQQQVGRAHQCTRQLQPHAPATREAVDRRVELGRLEAQPQQQGLRARAGVEGAGFLEREVRVGDRVAVVGGLCGGEHRLRLGQRDVALQHEVGGAVRGLGHLLRDLAQAPRRRDLAVAGVGVQAAGEQREQARLAGAVAPDQADLLAGVEHEVRALEHDLGTAAQREVSQGDHGARLSARRGSARRDRVRMWGRRQRFERALRDPNSSRVRCAIAPTALAAR